MRVLVTGDRGYVGSVLTPLLLAAGHDVVGLDAGWFDGCELGPVPAGYRELTGDVRDVTPYHLAGFDAVLHLACVFGADLGDLDRAATTSINLDGSLHLAATARAAGVPRFVLGSASPRRAGQYAEDLHRAERAIATMAGDGIAATFLRCGEVYGSSPRLRTDLPLNRAIARAALAGRAPLAAGRALHVRDLAAAFMTVLAAPRALTAGRVADATTLVRPAGRARSSPGAGSLSGELADDLRRHGVTAADLDGPRFVRVARVRELIAGHRMGPGPERTSRACEAGRLRRWCHLERARTNERQARADALSLDEHGDKHGKGVLDAAAFGADQRPSVRPDAGELRPRAAALVARAEDPDGQRPRDRQVGIVVRDRDVLRRIVRPVDAVADVGDVAEHLEAVQEPARDVEHRERLVVETERLRAAEGRRVRPGVDQDVEDGAACAADQLALPRPEPTVQPPDSALA